MVLPHEKNRLMTLSRSFKNSDASGLFDSEMYSLARGGRSCLLPAKSHGGLQSLFSHIQGSSSIQELIQMFDSLWKALA